MNKVELEESRREFLLKSISAGTLAVSASSGLLVPAPAQSMGKIPEQLIPGKSIYDMRGTVLVDGVKANEDTLIKASSKVETKSGSHVVFVIGSDGHVLRENSTVQFKGSEFFEEGLRLVTGKLLSVFGARPKHKQHTLRTSTATIGIRGTGVYTESYEDASYLCTCYGTVDVYADNDDNSAERIVSKKHENPRYILADGSKGKYIEDAPIKNHSVEELILVESLVGRKPPVSFVSDYSPPREDY